MTISLTQKEVSGYGCYHVFRNEAGKMVKVKCTDEEYNRMGEKGGARYNPKLDRHIWLHSNGGVPEIEGRPIEEEELIVVDGRQIAKISGREVLIEKGDLDSENNFVGVIKN